MPTIYSASKKQKKLSKKLESKRIQRVIEILKDQKTTNPLAAFAILPQKVAFETQETKEKIILLLRRHFIVNLPWIFIFILALFVPFIFHFFPFYGNLPSRFQLITIIYWYLFCSAFFLENFLSWYFNVLIVTDERVIDIDFYSLIYKEITAAKIESIQDITVKSGGLVRTLFDFGNVFIQTAGTVPEIEFTDVPHPSRVAEILNNLILEEEQEKIDGRVR